MNKSIKTNKLFTKKRLLISIPFFIILSPLIIFGIYSLVVNPILDKIDHDKFNMLDSQMQSLYTQIKTASNGAEDWKYSAVCETNHSGDWPTGTYYCTTLISMQQNITSAQELNTIHTKYYSTFSTSDIFDKTLSSNLKSVGSFGKEFMVSAAYQDYVEIKSGVGCTYTAQTNQTDEYVDYQKNNYTMGSLITGGQAKLNISLNCSSNARDYWYTISNPNMRPSTNDPLKRP